MIPAYMMHNPRPGEHPAAWWSRYAHLWYLSDYVDADWRASPHFGTIAEQELQAEVAATVGITQSDDAEGIGSVREESAERADLPTAREAYGPLGAALEHELVQGDGQEDLQDRRQLPYPEVVVGVLRIESNEPRNRKVIIDGFIAEVSEMVMPMVRGLAGMVVKAELINNLNGWWWLHNIEPVSLGDAGAPAKAPDDLEYQQVHGWRSMQPADLKACRDWLADAVFDRLRIGRDAYRSDVLGFQGDPLDHALEEWLDHGVYLFWERRRRCAERRQIDRILALLWQSYCDGLPPPQNASDASDDFVYWLTHQDPSVFADQLPALREAWQRAIGDGEAGTSSLRRP